MDRSHVLETQTYVASPILIPDTIIHLRLVSSLWNKNCQELDLLTEKQLVSTDWVLDPRVNLIRG